VASLEKIKIRGFKSIRNLELDLKPLNVLIGANGAGKSNFLSVFEFLYNLACGQLQLYVGESGGAEPLLHYGSKETKRISLSISFASINTLPLEYNCNLIPSAEDSLIFEFERETGHVDDGVAFATLKKGYKETQLIEAKNVQTFPKAILPILEKLKVYHFHDTSASAEIKKKCKLDDNRYLRTDGSNLAAYLYMLQKSSSRYYDNIVGTIRLAAPFFDDFQLRPDPLNNNRIKLEWREKGSDAYFDASSLSDGTLRFMCLATLLLQPNVPDTVIIDEPELGLHPYAIALVADMLSSVSAKKQVIVSTQSVTLVNQFAPEDIIVVERDKSQSVFKRPTVKEISSWLEDYGLGDLWEKNIIGGRPS
jgi:predicted ATPase